MHAMSVRRFGLGKRRSRKKEMVKASFTRAIGVLPQKDNRRTT